MRFEYKVTVIIPVYNAEKTLGQTMDSLFAQTMAQGLMEILLIDDGSWDGSPALCDAYARDHENVRVIHQENKGVSAARNAGIRAAKGKYLMYLDGDDTLSCESIENLTEFFDEHYSEIDVVSYPIAFCYANGREEHHYRSKIMTTTGVYDTEKTRYVNLTTINVLVKNQGSRNLLFDETVTFHEDEAYLAELVMKTGRFGFVVEATYYYDKSGGSVTNKFSDPRYIFDSSMELYERLFARYTKNGAVSQYIQALVLNDFNWKIAQGKFFPSHCAGEEQKTALARISALVDQMSTEMIMDQPNMEQAYKYYLLSMRTKGRPFACADNAGLKTVDNTGELLCEKPVDVVINQLEATRDGFYMLAYVKSFAFAFTREVPRLFMTLPGGKQKELPLFYSQFSCFWTKFETNRFYAFHADIPAGRPGRVKFEVSLQDRTYPVQLLYTKKQRAHPYFGCSYLLGKEYSLLCDKDHIDVLPTDSADIRRARRGFERKLFWTHKKWWLARQLMKRYQGRRVWLYFDSHDSLDNGYYQFLHDIEKQDGVRRYYVYHADNPRVIEGKFSDKAKGALVAFNSRKHKCLMAAAEKVLTAFIDPSCWLPFDPDTYQYYADLFRYEVVYLQHGVMHAKLPHMYSKEKVWQADQVVVSTRFERENLLELGYREQDILTCGMPRLDRLARQTADGGEKKILFAPSWRVSLVETVDGAQTPVEEFFRSTYYREFLAFLRDPRLRECLEKHDLYLDIQIHPMFSCYHDCFASACSERIRLTQQANVGEYLICITDFSSFMFDFLYLDRPVISYFPDREEFRSGSHSYTDFYYPIEDGFALYCENSAQTIDMLEQLVQNGFALPAKWAKRAEGIYYNDAEMTHREKLYRILAGDE